MLQVSLQVAAIVRDHDSSFSIGVTIFYFTLRIQESWGEGIQACYYFIYYFLGDKLVPDVLIKSNPNN
jgi:hypothetical protein